MGRKPTPVDPPSGSAVLVLAGAICDAQVIIAECFEQDLHALSTSFASFWKTEP